MTDASKPMNHGDLGDNYMPPRLYNEDEVADLILEAQAEAFAELRDLVERVKKTRTAWLEQQGVPISQEFVGFAAAIGHIQDMASRLSPDPNYRERIEAQARLDEAKWWEHLVDEEHHEEFLAEGEPCIYCERINTLKSELERLKPAEGK